MKRGPGGLSLIFATVWVAARLRGRWFRRYSFATLLVMLVFGVLTGLMAPSPSSGASNPWFGLSERIDIGAFLLWVVVLASVLLRADTASEARGPRPEGGMPARAIPAK